jgi:hypothetical protein
MDVDKSSARGASANKELMDTQAELLTLLQRFVCLLTSDAIINTQIHTEVCGGPAHRNLRNNLRRTLIFKILRKMMQVSQILFVTRFTLLCRNTTSMESLAPNG